LAASAARSRRADQPMWSQHRARHDRSTSIRCSSPATRSASGPTWFGVDVERVVRKRMKRAKRYWHADRSFLPASGRVRVGPHGDEVSYFAGLDTVPPTPAPPRKRGRSLTARRCRGVPLARRPFAQNVTAKRSPRRSRYRVDRIRQRRAGKKAADTARAALMCAPAMMSAPRS